MKKYEPCIEKRKYRLALRSTAQYFFRTRRRGTRTWYVINSSSSTAAAQQQLSSSSAAAQQKQRRRRRRWLWRRRRRKRRQHGKPFFAQLSQQHRGPPEEEDKPYKKYGRHIITPPDAVMKRGMTFGLGQRSGNSSALNHGVHCGFHAGWCFPVGPRSMEKLRFAFSSVA